jgi:hypothetical protein
MRRLLLLAAGLAALTVSAPATALASHGHHHHHHKRETRHAKVRFEHVGPTGTSATGSGPGAGNLPATTPTAPTTENAGKVASYTGGVLTLTLNDGSSVSGKVTNATRIGCIRATVPPPGPGQGDDNGPGDDNGEGDDNHQGDQQGAGQPPSSGAGALQGMHGEDGSDDDGGNPAAGEPPCDTSALIAGAIVREAELRIGPGGTEFESIELVR